MPFLRFIPPILKSRTCHSQIPKSCHLPAIPALKPAAGGSQQPASTSQAAARQQSLARRSHRETAVCDMHRQNVQFQWKSSFLWHKHRHLLHIQRRSLNMHRQKIKYCHMHRQNSTSTAIPPMHRQISHRQKAAVKRSRAPRARTHKRNETKRFPGWAAALLLPTCDTGTIRGHDPP